MSKRASYREGVAWIAENDEPETLDVSMIDGYISTLLLADLFGKEPADVAADIARYRRKQNHQREMRRHREDDLAHDVFMGRAD